MTDHYCDEHSTEYFKKGAMKSYAHPIGDTGKWCNEEKKAAPKTDGTHVVDAPPAQGEKVKEPNYRSPVNRSISLSYVTKVMEALIQAGVLKEVTDATWEKAKNRAADLANWMDE